MMCARKVCGRVTATSAHQSARRFIHTPDQQAIWAFSQQNPLRALYKGHKGLSKAESSLLVQARTGKIGFRAFLFSRKIPGIPTPLCDCGEVPETVSHLLEGCTANQEAYQLHQREGPASLLVERLKEGGVKARPILQWLMRKLPEYRLAYGVEG